MPRAPRVTDGGIVYHVLNRANGRMDLFETEEDYLQFEQVLIAAHERVKMRTLGYCVMPTHWHLVLWPRRDGDLSEFMQWLTLTHTQRWHASHGTVGSGHIYQGRYKSFPVQRRHPAAAEGEMGLLEGNNPVLSVLRYVERNALRAGLVVDAAAWRWGSAWRRVHGLPETSSWLAAIPGGLPDDWHEVVNRPQTDAELTALHCCVRRGRPYGGDRWIRSIVRRFGLELTLRPRGRPKRNA